MARAIWIVAGVLTSLGGLRAQDDSKTLEKSFQDHVKPFLRQHCERCHNAEKLSSGVRVDHLDASLEDRHLKLWEAVAREVVTEAMPPEGEKQPAKAERARAAEWIGKALAVARSRPAPKNGSVRRLTVAQYKNTLRELLQLDDDLADILPPDAVSKDGFLNNQSTLQLSPLLLETYFEIAEKALSRTIIDPKSKPTIQNFRLDFGAGINPKPIPDNLILGADSNLLKTSEFTVTELKPAKPFDFDAFKMRTKYRFIEGYQGNDTVRGWREYDSIYHSVFACMRGNNGYPKGNAHNLVPNGLLLRPAIPSAELFGVESTYGPKANFKIALRELPENGKFRVTVNAARYEDGLLLDPGVSARPANAPGAIVVRDTLKTPRVAITKPGIYQVDILPAEVDEAKVVIDASRLEKDLIGSWSLNGNAEGKPAIKDRTGKLLGDAKFVDSPFGKAVSISGNGSVMTPRHESMNVRDGDFTVAAWIHPRELRQSGIVCLGKYSWTNGWYLDMPDNRGVLRIETAGPDNQSNGAVTSPPGTLRANAWQHVAAVVRRGKGETQLFVNGHMVAKGKIGPANLDNPKVDLHIGRIQDSHGFRGEIDEVFIHRRALDVAEIQALVEPGRALAVKPPVQPKEVTLSLGDRFFAGALRQPAFVAVRLPAGELSVRLQSAGRDRPGKIVLTPLEETDAVAKNFLAFEQRHPLLGVHMGFRRDCGSTLAPVGSPRMVSGTQVQSYVFEGAIRNYPNPETEKDNVNYLAGVREIGVRSEYTDGRDRPRLMIRSVDFEGPFYETWPPPGHRAIFAEFDRKDDQQAYARHLIRTFAGRAYRRPITPAEESALMGVYDKAVKAGGEFRENIRDVAQVILTSPQFLFLIENSQTPKGEPLEPFELASKLSYFLWNSPPDPALLKQAAAGDLDRNLDAEVTRLTQDPRFDLFVSEYVAQWLALDKFQVLEPDRKLFPRLTRDTRVQLRQEPVQYLRHLIRANMPVRNLIDGDFVLANEVTADYYGLESPAHTGFGFVPMPHRRPELGGVLTQAAIMAGLSDGRESNPVKRGAWFARRIIAEPPDDPPPNVPALKPETKNLSLRERLEMHRSQKGCAQCHAKIDPWGVPFEEFDAGGRRKTAKIDARSTLPDKADVAGFDDLRRHLVNDRIDQVAFGFLKHLATYATGRNLTYQELEYLRQQGKTLKADGYRMQDMVRFVVKSPIFLEK